MTVNQVWLALVLVLSNSVVSVSFKIIMHQYNEDYMSFWLISSGEGKKKVKVKFSPLQALEALRVVRGWGSHIF
jgi:hypothetical protein